MSLCPYVKPTFSPAQYQNSCFIQRAWASTTLVCWNCTDRGSIPVLSSHNQSHSPGIRMRMWLISRYLSHRELYLFETWPRLLKENNLEILSFLSPTKFLQRPGCVPNLAHLFHFTFLVHCQSVYIVSIGLFLSWLNRPPITYMGSSKSCKE